MCGKEAKGLALGRASLPLLLSCRMPGKDNGVLGWFWASATRWLYLAQEFLPYACGLCLV